jgi:hypothetical protein
MSTIAELVVGGSPEPWENFGFSLLSVSADESRFSLGDVVLVVRQAFPPGMVSWTLATHESDVVGDISIDGVDTQVVGQVEIPKIAAAGVGAIGCLGVDHVVIRTNSLDITCDGITHVTGAPVKRVRDAGSGVQQAFHKLGNVVVEVVESPQRVDATHLWGFVVNVADINGLSQFMGPDVLGAPKPATQPGRHIASARSAAELGVPFAVMDKPAK